MTYLQALVSVAQAQLPAGHHGLLGAPGLSTDQTPALRPVRVRAQHLQAALVTGSSSCESDLCGADGVRAKQGKDTQEPGWIKTLRFSWSETAFQTGVWGPTGVQLAGGGPQEKKQILEEGNVLSK